MNQHHALATRQAGSLLPDTATWGTMLNMAEALVASGLLPEAIKTPQAAVAIIQKGSELGIPPMYALSNIVVIKGKPTANAELMLALIYRDHGDNAIIFAHSDNTSCVATYKRRSWAQARTYEFTITDAKTAQLLGNQTWSKYPAAMLRARCISAVARMAFPDSIGGMYTPEELGADVIVIDDAVVVRDASDMTVSEVFDRNPIVAVQAMNYVYENEDRETDDDEPSMQDEVEAIDAMPLDDRQLIERTEILQELSALTDRRDLSPYIARIRAAGLNDDQDVRRAFSRAQKRLGGAVDAPSDVEQPALV